MGRVLIAGLAVLVLGAIALVGFSSQSQAQSPTDTETPAPSASATETPASASATPTESAAATTSGSATATATARAQPAAVPVTGGNPSDGSPNLALILAIALGAIAGTGGVLAASYGLTRRS